MRFEPADWAVVPLDNPLAHDPSIIGAKAAHLAHAAMAGLPVLPGFVLVPASRVPGATIGTEPPRTGHEALRAAWRTLAEERDTRRPLVVRSSSRHEDSAESSMAGHFDSVLDVRGWEDFVSAVRTVLASARRIRPLRPTAEQPPTGDDMAVLVQPMLTSAVGGVMFGADPVAGRTDRILVSAVRGGPDQLVGGGTQGTRYQLTRYARVVGGDSAAHDGPLSRGQLVRLVSLARKTQRLFGSPQDMEFGFDGEGRLWLFQARPITAMTRRPPRGARLLGPGPVAETLPGVLQPLEEDLWLTPMSQGLKLALDIAGAAPRRRLRGLPVVRTVRGRAVADLRLLGVVPPAHPLLDRVNPAPGARRAAAAWRVGRLRSALPLLALDLMADVDRALAEFPPPAEMLSGWLVDAVAWGRQTLSALHAQESLAGALLRADHGATAAGEALAELAEGRSRKLTDEQLIARHPVVLTLLPPALAARPPLPATDPVTALPRGVGVLPAREGLRLRIRWVQEMQVRMLAQLADRLAGGHGTLPLSRLALLRWDEVVHAAQGGGLPADLADRVSRPDAGTLPVAFRLADGVPVAAPTGASSAPDQGQGAGGGFGAGTAWDGQGQRPERPVLIVASLDPSLAPLLPDLAGLVAETGSPLSHLAVLAREYHVPTAVGVIGATVRFPTGTPLTVDGGTGAVTGRDVPRIASVTAGQEPAA
ncbi:PEP/pyruvate-binding domain-containing protein [Streptomyces wuyuanensis]|uniref:Pyruvate, water dikinase n=1 Tax=Streptomyces wuyuanensis TaxID=1196353 RepID=A0A1H0DN55_9ACTN|nr:PEP/pyruvate-binding domain-containing protein [Streptomyces wuyuanensis]SDN71610.1 pyruvate, water dikinase [Streptomyces wuyuanensis]